MCKRLVFYLFPLLFFACTDKTGNRKEIAEKEQISVLDIPEGVFHDYFVNHFSLDRIVPIETTDNFLLSSVDKVQRTEKGILLLSVKDGVIAMVDAASGKLLFQIRRRGTGPGEYNNLKDVVYDEANKVIYAYNDYKKVFLYDLEGRFLSEISVDALYGNMLHTQGKLVFFDRGEGYTRYPYRLAVYDLHKRQWTHVGNEEAVNFCLKYKGSQAVKSKHVWLNAPLDFTLYRLEKDSMKPGYYLNFPTEPLEQLKRVTDFSDLMKMMQTAGRIVYGVNSVRECERHLVFQDNQGGFYFLDKGKNLLYKDRFILKDLFNLSANDYCPHDGDDNSLLFVLNPVRMVEAEAEPRVRIDVKEDDNPVLFFFKEK